MKITEKGEIAKKVKAVVLEEPRKLVIREIGKPKLGPLDILLRVVLCGVCGSDVHMWEGRLGVLPCVMGHEIVGEVVEGSARALGRRHLEVGDAVAVELMMPCGKCLWCRQGQYHLCYEDNRDFDPAHGWQYGCNIPVSRPPTPLWGGYAQYLYIPPRAILHKYRDGINPHVGIFTEPLATAVHAINTGGLRPGFSCVVVGPGTIGLCIVMAAKWAGASPIVLVGAEGDEYRLSVGCKLGADYTLLGESSECLRTEIRRITGGWGADVSFESAGAPSAQISALRTVREGGTCVLLGISGQKELTVVPDRDLVFKEIRLIGCKLSPHGFETAVKIIESQRFPIEELFSREYSLYQVEEALKNARDKMDNTIKVAINPWLES